MDYKILLNKLLHKRFKKLLAVDIAGNAVNFAVVDCGGRAPVVTGLWREVLPAELQNTALSFNAGAMAGFICGVVKREEINADAVIFTVNAENSAILTLELPNMPDSELQEAARWELAQELNSEPDSFCYTAAFAAQQNEGLNMVMAAVMPQSAAKAFTEIAVQLDLPLCGVFMRSAAVEQTFAKSYTDFILLDSTAENEAALTAFYNGLPVYQKQFNGEFTAENLTAGIMEMQTALPGAELKQIIINGNCPPDLANEIERLTALSVVVNDITHSIGFSEDLKAENLQQLSDFAAVIGAALCYTNGGRLNLLPLKQNAAAVNRWQVYRAAAACCVICFLAAWAWQLVLLHNAQSDLQKVQQQINAMGKWQQRYEEAAGVNGKINRRLKLAETLRADNTDWPQVLTAAADSIANGCWLEKIEQGQDKQISISGYAHDMDKAVEFAEALKKTNISAKAELTELKSAKYESRNVAAFNLLLERK